VDIHSAVGRDQGIRDDQFETVAEFESSPAFDAKEKAVLRLTEAMTATPATIPDQLFAELQKFFDVPQLVELAAAVALENFRARFNRVFEVGSDDFCTLPPDHPVRRAGRH
jgi:alkylhydroperoxidase family enzyme